MTPDLNPRRQLSSSGDWPSIASSEHPNAMAVAASVASHASNASVANDEDIDIEKAERWNQTGKAMVTAPLTPGWSSLQTGTLLQHGEAMIREQEDLQHKKKLYQTIALEGRASPMRQHLAEKIETRMREEKTREAQAAMEVQQSCTSIGRHLDGMRVARKNLNTLRLETQHTLQLGRQGCKGEGLSLDLLFHKSQKKHLPVIMDEEMANMPQLELQMGEDGFADLWD